MLQELQQLKDLVLKGGFDSESQQQVASLESRLHEIAVKENLADNPIVKPYIAYLQAEIDRSELLLKTDKKLTDRERDALFARMELADQFVSIFSGKQRAAIEEEIKRLLHVATNS